MDIMRVLFWILKGIMWSYASDRLAHQNRISIIFIERILGPLLFLIYLFLKFLSPGINHVGMPIKLLCGREIITVVQDEKS
jgi:hypothetical protein